MKIRGFYAVSAPDSNGCLTVRVYRNNEVLVIVREAEPGTRDAKQLCRIARKNVDAMFSNDERAANAMLNKEGA